MKKIICSMALMAIFIGCPSKKVDVTSQEDTAPRHSTIGTSEFYNLTMEKIRSSVRAEYSSVNLNLDFSYVSLETVNNVKKALESTKLFRCQVRTDVDLIKFKVEWDLDQVFSTFSMCPADMFACLAIDLRHRTRNSLGMDEVVYVFEHELMPLMLKTASYGKDWVDFEINRFPSDIDRQYLATILGDGSFACRFYIGRQSISPIKSVDILRIYWGSKNVEELGNCEYKVMEPR